MRLQFRLVQVAIDLRGRNRLHDAPLLGFVGQLMTSPVSDRAARFLGWFAGQRQDLGDLLGRELAGIARTRFVAQHLFNGSAEVGQASRALDDCEAFPRLGPPPPPHSDGIPIEVDFPGDVLIVGSLKGPQDNGGPLREVQWSSPRMSDVLKNLLLTFRDQDSGCRPWHEIASCETRTWERQEVLPKF